MARRLAPGALAVFVLALLAVIVLGGGSQHRLRAVFVAALQVRPGEEVRLAGRTVGSIDSVSLSDGQALVAVHVDDQAWPLPAGTTAQLRFGAAAAYASRYIQLQPGPATNPPLAENALLPASDTVTPVEFDQIVSMYDRQTRSNLKGLLGNGAQFLSGHDADLADAFSQGSRGFAGTAGMLGDLGLDPGALNGLVTDGAKVLAALRSTQPQLQGLVSNAAETSSVFADNANALSASIAKFPTTLEASQYTLGQFDRSLYHLDTLVTDTAPGARGLVTTAPLLRQTLDLVLTRGPAVVNTLTAGTGQLPALTHFLGESRQFSPGLSRTLARLAPMVACVRPYAPEIGGYLGTWQAGPYDVVGHYARTNLIETPYPPGTSVTAAQAVATSGGTLHYAFPRPPGLNAGRSWFQPQCGAGPRSLDPNADPEAGK